MDPQVAIALKERDRTLRQHGFPDLPDHVKNSAAWQLYQRSGGLNPLVFADLDSLVRDRRVSVPEAEATSGHQQ